MSLEEYTEELTQRIEDLYKDKAKIETVKVLKLNGTEERGFRVLPNGKNLAPVFYFDQLYFQYDGNVEKTIEGIGDFQINDKGLANEFANALDDWSKVRRMVFPALINTEDNEKLLGTLVHEEFLDLSVIFLIREAATGGGFLCVKVTEVLLQNLGVDYKTLRTQAFRNMKEEGYTFMDMNECLFKYMSREYGEDGCDMSMVETGKMMVLTNPGMYWGAASMIDKDMLKEKLGDKNCFILPSSLHELIIVPDNGEFREEDLTEMVREVNNNVVERRQVLSDHSYYYDGGTHEVRMCA